LSRRQRRRAPLWHRLSTKRLIPTKNFRNFCWPHLTAVVFRRRQVQFQIHLRLFSTRKGSVCRPNFIFVVVVVDKAALHGSPVTTSCAIGTWSTSLRCIRKQYIVFANT
jgi:G:T/U-mismatch repair DNA glycosylase